MRYRKHFLLIVVTLLVVLAGCTSRSEQRAEVEAVVRQYNVQLAQGLRELDMNALSGVATKSQAELEFAQMAALGESRVFLDSTMSSIVFESVEFASETSATVTTAETWEYRHISLDTSETVREEKNVKYRLVYELELTDGRWLVNSVASAEESPSEEAKQ